MLKEVVFHSFRFYYDVLRLYTSIRPTLGSIRVKDKSVAMQQESPEAPSDFLKDPVDDNTLFNGVLYSSTTQVDPLKRQSTWCLLPVNNHLPD